MRLLGVITLLFAVAGCADHETPPPPSAGRPTVYAVNYPLQYMAQRIGGDLVDVFFPCPAGIDPAHWMPDDATVEAYQGADLILLNGAAYAGWTRSVSLPPSRLVVTSAGFRDDYIHVSGMVTHGHGPAGEHTHGPIASATWLDPVQAIAQAAAVRDAFVGRWPAHRSVFEAGYESLGRDLALLDDRLERLFAARRDEPLLSSDPTYAYLARRYGIQQIEPIEPPGIAGIDFLPCANTPPDGDYMSVMEANVKGLE